MNNKVYARNQDRFILSPDRPEARNIVQVFVVQKKIALMLYHINSYNYLQSKSTWCLEYPRFTFLSKPDSTQTRNEMNCVLNFLSKVSSENKMAPESYVKNLELGLVYGETPPRHSAKIKQYTICNITSDVDDLTHNNWFRK